jgi:hypothetical protein
MTLIQVVEGSYRPSISVALLPVQEQYQRLLRRLVPPPPQLHRKYTVYWQFVLRLNSKADDE